MSVRFQVVRAIRDLVETAVSPVPVTREGEPPSRIDGGELVILRDVPGDDTDVMEETMSVRAWSLSHRLELVFLRQDPDDRACEQALDGRVDAVSDALMADPTLGGIAEGLRLRPPAYERLRAEGDVPIGVMTVPVTVEYQANRPTG